MTTGITVTVNTTRSWSMVVLTTSPAATRAEVQRSADGGTTWQVVRGNDPADWTKVVLSATGGATIRDAEQPLDVELIYRARANDGVVVDPFVEAAPVTVPGHAQELWLIAPVAYPTQQMSFMTRQQTSYVRDDPLGVFYALGRRDPIVTAGTRRAPVGDLTLLVESNARRAEAEALLDAHALFTVRSPASHAWGVRLVAFGAATLNRLVPNKGREWWDLELEWWAVSDAEDVPVIAYGSTYLDLATEVSDYAEVQTRWASYGALKVAVI